MAVATVATLVPPSQRRNPRLAAAEEPCFVFMLDKAAHLKRCKVKGRHAPSGSSSHPEALPAEHVEVAASSPDFLPPSDILHLGSACGVSKKDLNSIDFSASVPMLPIAGAPPDCSHHELLAAFLPASALGWLCSLPIHLSWVCLLHLGVLTHAACAASFACSGQSFPLFKDVLELKLFCFWLFN